MCKSHTRHTLAQISLTARVFSLHAIRESSMSFFNITALTQSKTFPTWWIRSYDGYYTLFKRIVWLPYGAPGVCVLNMDRYSDLFTAHVSAISNVLWLSEMYLTPISEGVSEKSAKWKQLLICTERARVKHEDYYLEISIIPRGTSFLKSKDLILL